MKIRQDFVTNSSSSSYIISFDSNGFDLKNPFVKICWKFMIGDGKFIRNENDLNNNFIDDYGYGDCKTIESILKNDKFLEERYNEILNELKAGKFILQRDVDYNDETTSEIIEQLAKQEQIKILQGDY